MSEIYVSQLTTYPIKSCAGIDIPGSVVEPTGLEFDRQWMVTRANGKFLTQRTNPELALVSTEFTVGGLVVSAEGHGSFTVPLEADETTGNPEYDVEVFKKPGKGREQGPEANEFFSDYLDIPAMFLRVSQTRLISQHRWQDGFSDRTGFADGAPILLASAVSLRALQEASDKPIEMNRFRPNIVVDGEGLEPFEEDFWRDITIGNTLKARVAWACARCPMPNVDQSTGILPKPAERYVTRVLQEQRSGIDISTGRKEVFFGQNLLPRFSRHSFEIIDVGNEVVVDGMAFNRNIDPNDQD